MNLEIPPKDLLEKFSNQRILVIGDIMLDQFVRGSVNRISPEAPVPVVEVESDECFLGGAANVARNLIEFSPNIYLAGRVGNDECAAIIRGKLLQSQIKGLIASDFRATTVKTRIAAGNQQIVRIDREDKSESNQVSDILIKKISDIIGEIDAIIIEDYGKGLITDYFLNRLDDILPKYVKVMFDPKPSNPVRINRWYHTVKPNKQEALSYCAAKDIETAGKDLLELWNCQNVLITLGKDGMVLFNDTISYIPALSKDVYDVSGAGDTSIAIYTLAICSGYSSKESAQIANIASGVSISKAGTTPVTKEELINKLSNE